MMLDIDKARETKNATGKNQRTSRWTNNKGECGAHGCSNKAYRGKESLGVDLCQSHYRKRTKTAAVALDGSGDGAGYDNGYKAGLRDGYKQAKEELRRELESSFPVFMRELWTRRVVSDTNIVTRTITGLFNRHFGTRMTSFPVSTRKIPKI